MLHIIRDDSEVLDGAAQAAEQIGEKEKAHHYYAKLTEQTAKADGSRSELAQLREYRAAWALRRNRAALPNPASKFEYESLGVFRTARAARLSAALRRRCACIFRRGTLNVIAMVSVIRCYLHDPNQLAVCGSES